MADTSDTTSIAAADAAVAVIGTGTVGSTLARQLARAGRIVAFGTRRADDQAVQSLVAPLGPNGGAFSPTGAIERCPVVVLALPGAAVAPFIDAHADALAGKVVIDPSNDLRRGHSPAHLSSLAHLSRRAPTALGYRAFNSVGFENMADPRFGDQVADLFYAGPDEPERETVEAVIDAVGFRPIWVGDSDDDHAAVDALATLWFSLAFARGRGRRLAFRLLDASDDAPTVDQA